VTESLQALLFLSQLLGFPLGPAETGRLSVYRPGDGSCGTELACGGTFTRTQRHIAHRRWWKHGCGRVVLIHAVQTGRWAAATVQDGGPYGAYRGRLRQCVKEGRYRVASRRERRRGKLRAGWKWRGLTDLSWAVWLDLGRPDFLSEVRLYFFPFRGPLRRSGRVERYKRRSGRQGLPSS